MIPSNEKSARLAMKLAHEYHKCGCVDCGNSEREMHEKWKDIPGYEKIYQASCCGKIRSVDRQYIGKDNIQHEIKGKNIVARYDKLGYARVKLSKLNIKKQYLIHRLVMLTFCGYSNQEINHKDCNPSNNKLSNLEYCTRSYNIKYTFMHGRKPVIGSKNGKSILTEEDVKQIKIKIKTKEDKKHIAKLYNVNVCTIHDISTGRTWRHV